VPARSTVTLTGTANGQRGERLWANTRKGIREAVVFPASSFMIDDTTATLQGAVMLPTA
jgi:hypothetical protein